jgi:hypothetical protein
MLEFNHFIAILGTLATILSTYISTNSLKIWGIKKKTVQKILWVLGLVALFSHWNERT